MDARSLILFGPGGVPPLQGWLWRGRCGQGGAGVARLAGHRNHGKGWSSEPLSGHSKEGERRLPEEPRAALEWGAQGPGGELPRWHRGIRPDPGLCLVGRA